MPTQDEHTAHLSQNRDARVKARLVGSVTRHVPLTRSTMDDVAALARDESPEGLVLLADQQTAGRGRHQRTWDSSPGDDLLLSILFRPRPAIAGEINMLLALAIAETVKAHCGAEPAIKWPNDVRISGAKIAGILLESNQHANGIAVVAGIGLNVNSQMRDKNPGGTEAVSIRDLAGEKLDRERVLDTLLERIDSMYAAVRYGGTIVPAWRSRLDTLGKRVDVTYITGSEGQKVISGVAEDVDGSGRLIVRDKSGRAWPVSAGEVTLQARPS